MREHEAAHYFGLDIGTSTVRCVIGMLDDADMARPSIIGHGSAPNLGMRKGVVVHIDDVVEAAAQAITEAERVSGLQVQTATVNVNGPSVQGMNSKGVIAISSPNREITTDDRLRVEEAAITVKMPPNREIIQVFAKNYRLDGQDNIKDPIGMNGVRLEVDTHIVTTASPSLKGLTMALEKSRVQPSHYVVSSLAAAEAVLSRQQKESGTVLLDIGAGTTNLVVLEDGEVQHVAVLPVGGINITNDLAIGLKTDLDVAEAVKVIHAGVGSKQKTGSVSVRVGTQEHSFKVTGDYGVNNIVEARLEDLFDMIDKELRKIGRSRKLPGGVVLVGGSAKLPGMSELAKEKLQLAARVGSLQAVGGLIDTVSDPAYATAVGLMQMDMLLGAGGAQQHGTGQPNPGVFGMVDGLLKRFRR